MLLLGQHCTRTTVVQYEVFRRAERIEGALVVEIENTVADHPYTKEKVKNPFLAPKDQLERFAFGSMACVRSLFVSTFYVLV